MPKLPNQALRYFRGQWPIYNPAPEPKALQELMDAGLIQECNDFKGKRWVLTRLGHEAKICKDCED
jgi:hypothetical protein